MPIYEYECSGCSHRFELRKSFNDDTLVSCPQCGCETQRIFSPVPVIFKGSGFYSTDNRDNHRHSASKAGTDEAKAGSAEQVIADETKATSVEQASADKAKAGSAEQDS